MLIIGLGAAAGDSMFYEDVGLIPAMVVFMIIIGMYRATTGLSGKSKKFEKLLEGKPVCLIMNGRFSIENFKKEDLAQDEFFSELRHQNVAPGGQVRIGFREPTSEISLLYYEDKGVKPGLPLIPDPYKYKQKNIGKKAIYACAFCGQVKEIEQGSVICAVCKGDEWVAALSNRRIL